MTTQSSGIEGLGYIGVRAKELGDWGTYAAKMLGMQRIDKSLSSLALRMDDRKQPLVVAADRRPGIGLSGVAVADAAAFPALAVSIDAAGHHVHRVDADRLRPWLDRDEAGVEAVVGPGDLVRGGDVETGEVGDRPQFEGFDAFLAFAPADGAQVRPAAAVTVTGGQSASGEPLGTGVVTTVSATIDSGSRSVIVRFRSSL